MCLIILALNILSFNAVSDKITIVTNNERDSMEQLITVEQGKNRRVLVCESFRLKSRKEGQSFKKHVTCGTFAAVRRKANSNDFSKLIDFVKCLKLFVYRRRGSFYEFSIASTMELKKLFFNYLI